MSTELAIGVAIALVVAWMVIKMKSGETKMSASGVQEKIKAGAKIIDVRSLEEFREGAYPGAVNIPLPELKRRLAEIPQDKTVVLYCMSGARSAMAARTLKMAGYENVVNAGGLGDMPR